MHDVDDSDVNEAFLGSRSKSADSDSAAKRKKYDCCASNKLIWVAAFLIISVAMLLIIVFGVVLNPLDTDDGSSNEENCYIYPACTTKLPPNSKGFTNNTGFMDGALTDSSVQSCCEVCLPGTNATVCFSSDGSCSSKTGDGDYDFLLLDEIWMPQFCNALGHDYDPTLSHLSGMRCEFINTELSIHGLWPNFVDGYPQCCNASGNLMPLDPTAVLEWEIYPALAEQWYDPTAAADCSTCYLLNHEWEKHGNCYTPGDPKSYFSTGILLKNRLQEIDQAISSYAGLVVNTSIIESLYPKKANMVCDPNDPLAAVYLNDGIGILLETQTCWNRDLEAIDCPPAFSGSFTYACPERVLLAA